MAKDLNNIVKIFDGNFNNIDKLLNEGKTILAAVEVGEFVKISLAKGFSEYFNANVELKETIKNVGVCGCGKPADGLIYIWRD